MKAMILRRRSSGGGLRIKRKGRGFMCGCGGSKAVSVSDGSSDKHSPMATPPTNTSTATTTMSMATTATTATRRAAGNSSKSASMISTAAAPSSFSPSSTDDADTSMGSTPSVAALLRQLGELERTVRSLQGGATVENIGGGRRHRRTASEGGGGAGARRIEESVAVVKESADPLADFRRSMLQMIVEKEIVGGDELQELLHRFLSLNAPHHHHLILRAFAEIWEEVFSGYERTPDFLVSHPRNAKRRLHLQREPAATLSSLR